MTPLLVIGTILFFLGLDWVVRKVREHREGFASKPEIYYHEPSFLPTPTMADGGELIEKKKQEESPK